MGYKLGELAEIIGAELRGDPECRVDGVATLARAGLGDLSFLHNRRYRSDLATTRASAVLLEQQFVEESPTACLVMRNPYAGYARAAALLTAPSPPPRGIHRSAVVGEGAGVSGSASIGAHCVIGPRVRIDEDAVIGPGCVLEGEIDIGAGAVLVANVTICCRTRLGRRTLVHPGVVIGADGFGIANDDGVWIKVPQVGGVVIGDDVEIGANTTVDRGTLDDTVIEDGVKLDNLIQIAHNVHIGAHTAIAACVAIGGSAWIGKGCTIAGAASIAGHIRLADGVHLTATSAVPNSIRTAGTYSSGMPIQENREWRKNVARVRQLDRDGPPGPPPRGPARARWQGRPGGWKSPRPRMTDMDITKVLDYLPHRYPMLLIDRIPRVHAGGIGARSEERHHKRALLSGTLSRPAGHAGGAHPRGDGAGDGGARSAFARRAPARGFDLLLRRRGPGAFPPPGRPRRPVAGGSEAGASDSRRMEGPLGGARGRPGGGPRGAHGGATDAR